MSTPSKRTYTEEELSDRILRAITRSKILDALSLAYYAGSRKDAAEEILKSANITRSEIEEHVDSLEGRECLFSLLDNK